MCDIDACLKASPVIERKSIRWQTIIACTYLCVMCIQYVPWEGEGVSPIKVLMMCFSPVFLLVFTPVFTKAVLWGGLYLLWIFVDMYSRFDNPRLETMGYSAMFFVTYMLFYELVCNKKVFAADSFIRLMKVIMWSYIIVLIVQQMVSLAGMRVVPLLNLNAVESAMKCQSLSIEPSHSARIMGALFYAFLKVTEYKNDKKISLSWLWHNERYLLIGFFYAMFSMQSATAILVSAIILFYFFRAKNLLFLILLFVLLLQIRYIAESEQVLRTTNIVESVLTFDNSRIIETDHSASFRILPILNFFHLDFFDIYTWIGHGTDTALYIFEDEYLRTGSLSTDVVNNGILDYGLISYIIGLIFVFTSCIKPFFCLATVLFFFGLGGSFGNVAYSWGILMIFTCMSFFYQQYHSKRFEDDESTTKT